MTDSTANGGGSILRKINWKLALPLLLIIAFIIWLVPKPFTHVAPLDGGNWLQGAELQQHRIVWRPAAELTNLLPKDKQNASVSTPRFGDHGTTLYFTVRSENDDADIYRSELRHGEWQAGRAVEALNSAGDDIGAVPSADGRQLFLYSNRPGGRGGFDIYVAQWKNGNWSRPVNAGIQINSSADEIDPAIAPDGRSLYFASNRDPAAENQQASNSPLRNRKADNFDLWVSARGDSTSDWEAVTALHAINESSSNEGAPFVSPNGAFLYFASDRSVRFGEEPNLDLFRAAITGGTFSSAQNLGPGINTPEDETEPALSAEGFTLAFAAHRDGETLLQTSRAEEIRITTGWDASNFRAVAAVWQQAVATTLLVVLIAFVFMKSRGRFAQAAGASRFFVGSICFHVLLVLLLAMWNLPRVIEVITSQSLDAVASTQLFDDNQHQSHEDGRAAYEKLADLQSLQDVAQPEVARTETEAFSVPERTDSPLPTIPLEVARTLPANRLLAVPPSRARPKRQQSASDVPMPAPARPVPQVVQAVMELSAAAIELPEPVENPGEKPIATRINMERTENVPEPVKFDVKNPEAPRLRPTSTTNLTPPAIEVGLQRKAATLPTNPLEMRVAQIPDEPEYAELADEIVLPAAPVTTVQKLSEEPPPLIDVAKTAGTTPKPVPFATSGRRMRTRQPQAFVEQNAPDAAVENRAADPSKMPPLPARDTAPAAPESALTEIAQLDVEDIALAAAELPDAAETDKATDGIELEIDRTDVSGPTPLTPQQMTGPASRNKQRIVVGAIDLKRNNAPPSLNMIASTLDRPLAKASAVSLAADSVGLRSMFTLRQGDTRKQFIELFGGTEETEKAVNRGLVWIAQHQNEDGAWSLNRFHENCKGKHPTCNGHGSEVSNTAATGMALLPLLAAGNTNTEGEYAAVVTKGLQWLIDHQKENGELLGPGDRQVMYSQGIAAIALCEAYGMTQSDDYKQPAQKALQFIIEAQNKNTGGWRYTPGEAGDTSVVGWQMMALKSGEMAGLHIPQATLDGIRKWLKSVEANTPQGGRFGYANRSATPSMTAEGLLCLQFLGTRRNDSAMRAGADYLLTQLPKLQQSNTSYYWYYGTQVMYHMQGSYWQEWNTALRDMVVETQIKDGHMAGTWNPIDQWEKRAGRIYSTSLKLLLLEIYYRHLPLYEQLDD